jgi:copper transporter 1
MVQWLLLSTKPIRQLRTQRSANAKRPCSGTGILKTLVGAHTQSLQTDTLTCFVGFIFPDFHVRHKFEFVLYCLGVFLIAFLLQLLRRLCRTYDRTILHNREVFHNQERDVCLATKRSSCIPISGLPGFFIRNNSSWSCPNSASISEQGIRATLYTLVLMVSYALIGLAMSFNGYVIICILLGAFIGEWAFGRDTLSIG